MASWASIGPGNWFRSVISTQATTESAPTDANAGMRLDDVGGFHLSFELASGETVSSAVGSFDAYIKSTDDAQWARAEEYDWDSVASWSGRRAAATTYTVNNPAGRIAHVANGLSISGGSITLRYVATGFKGDRR